MSRLVSTTAGIGRLEGEDTVACLDLPHADLGRALEAGLTVADLAAAPVRERVPRDGIELLAPIPRPS